MFLLPNNALAQIVQLTHVEIQKRNGIKSHAPTDWPELVASDCGWFHSWIPFLCKLQLKTFDEVEVSCCEFLLNPWFCSPPEGNAWWKMVQSFKMTDCILQNNFIFFFYLLPNKLNVHGKEFLGTVVFVFGMYFPTYGSSQHL